MAKKFILFLVVLLLAFGAGVWFAGRQGGRDRVNGGGTDGSTAINQRLEAELAAATIRIGELETGKEADRRTIEQLKSTIAASQQLYSNLRDSIKRQGDIAQRIEAGEGTDIERLNRLEEIIRGTDRPP